MKDYLRRMLDERNELATRSEKLEAFISSKEFQSLTNAKQSLMKAQASTMHAYLVILDERINLEDFSEASTVAEE